MATAVPLREHLEALIEALDRRVEQRIADQERAVGLVALSAKEALVKAETAIERRLDLLNEFRGALHDQTATMMPRAEIEPRLHLAETRLDKAEGRGGGLNAGWGYLVGVVGLAAAFWSVLT